MKINIVMLLTNSADELSDILPIPCEDAMLKILSLDQQIVAQSEYNMSETAAIEPKIREPCIVIWDQNDEKIWYLKMCRQCVIASHFLLEHLELVQSVQTKRYWQYSLKQDVQITLIDQIIPVKVAGAWNIKGWNYIFELDNWDVIEGIFKGLYMIWLKE